MIDEYLQKIQAALSASPFVAQPMISVDDRGEVCFIRADVYFIDNSLLHFRELFIDLRKLHKKTYSYHYQHKDGSIVFRYDNAPHYPDLPSAPHHKHVGDRDVIPSDAPDFFSVLKEIENLLQP